MSMWTAIVLIVCVGVVSEMYRARLKAGSESGKQREELELLSQRITRIEERMANIETIVLEREKTRPFDSLSDRA